MDIINFRQLFEAHPNIAAGLKSLDQYKNICIKGLTGSSDRIFLSCLYNKKPNCFLFILEDHETAGYFYHDMVQLEGKNSNILFFPSAYKRAIKYGQIDTANEILRTEVFSALQTEKPTPFIVTYPEALAEKVISKKDLQDNTLKISVNEKVDTQFISEVLDSYGFEYTDYVYEPGQYAIRGSIIDVFSFSNEYPYRIDFFGDEVETIRSFEVESQLSKERLNEIQIIAEMRKSRLQREAFFNLLPDNTIIGYNDLSWIQGRLNFIYEDEPVLENREYEKDLKEKLLSEKDFSLSIEKFKQIQLTNKPFSTPDITLTFDTELQPLFHKNFNLVSESFKKYLRKDFNIYILSDSDKQNERLKAIFEDRGDNIHFTPVNKTLHEGFIDNTLKICCFTDHQIFDRFHKYNLKSEKAGSGKIALSLKEIKQLQIGDYIVHVDHGIGKFGGLVRTDMNGTMQELIKLTYLNNDAIFVSIHSLHKISKYRGKEGEPPRINKLGTGSWERMKEKTKSRVKDIARDLILLYSKRRQEKGFQFSPDSFLQNELEASFIYEDTPDQLKATNDVKKDMEREIPMDRLICGDVGFGKTEVAIRAAFKAVTDNKQVAVLVPTTVLAAQHYHTFRDRLNDFPVKVDYISRARTAKQIKDILKKVNDGGIDILIGTHRLVSKDVIFKDLGLLIIDEEQKFGVAVKEKLKQMRTDVDTLTMTATPIPRTLQFSLMGARDLSSISTPPPNRYPIQTELHNFDINIIRDAINFEMSRNGQVFIINNRISNIYELEKTIKKTVPDARIVVGHGQLEPQKLETIITDFVNYEYDVLIATSIIESGIDIPNANTIIINNAQNFGLSDLHQLRGRVGRSNKKAFCYLLTPPTHTLNVEARRKLQAIENFSELGSGMHIAMQDLDIRGAGNMLGAEQSGFIADLGYETYQKILTEAVNELKNEEFSDIYRDTDDTNKLEGSDFVEDVIIESDLALFFPATYIPNDSERVAIYRELDDIESEHDLYLFTEKLLDRFGKIPKEGLQLIRIVELRRIAKKLGIEKLILKNNGMSLHFIANKQSVYFQSKAFGKVISYIQSNPRNCELKERSGKLSVKIKNVSDVEKACYILKEISNIATE